ncbi:MULTISPECIES: SDR family oxidoreductase [unclassified Mesorhizobium]|uniref:SDR family oxidoreductase n=1 Tax=unclassified Mesorhizobium TaxID=325217 RepID=UPI000FC9EA0A|nr:MULTISPECIES: SDR family oxidoreductase [unclassified Mesorhizobium]RUX34048.1 SDR family oxidoreductase [Mesorhizobium sp. M2A.F.Ca.ET.042.01.1.1]RWE79116.1 MAG: SDR family oxidoreductase [Mesorhizobium sp.]
MARHALIAGVSGIIGRHLAERLTAEDWIVTGISRHKHDLPSGVTHVAVDLTDEGAVKQALANIDPTDVFITTWLRQPTEAENCRVNAGMVRNLLQAMDGKPLRHVALVTGLKHYMGPFEAYAKARPVTPFREEQPRLAYQNFYYDQEDEVFAAAERQGFGWSVHRPHTLIGYAVGNQMNMAATLGAYAAICKETGRPFVFPGSPQQYEAAVDVTDGRIIAKHLLWAATEPAARNNAFNIVNGEVFRWNWLWPKLASHLGVATAEYPGHAQPLEEQMAGMEPVWDAIVAKHGLQRNPLNKVVSWWHSDADLGRVIENFTDMTKSRDMGFTAYQNSLRSFTDAFDKFRAAKVLP